MSVAPALVLREGDRDHLGELARLPSIPSGLAKRARMVLLAADGVPNAEIARRAGVSRPTVIGWRDRYRAGGIAALEDQPRSGRPAEIDEARVVVATLADGGRPPERLGVTCWSARVMAAELGISFTSVARIWRKWKIQPRRVDTFTFGTDPELEAKFCDIAGLYLAPPDNAVVVCVQSQLQDAMPLVAALGIATGQTGADARDPRHPGHEFLAFLKLVGAARQDVDLHVVLDSDGAHKHPKVRRWLTGPENKRITVHVTPAGCSWLTMVEIFCGLSTRPAAGRGTFRSVIEPAARISQFLDAYNDRSQPFTWTKEAGPFLANIRPSNN